VKRNKGANLTWEEEGAMNLFVERGGGELMGKDGRENEYEPIESDYVPAQSKGSMNRTVAADGDPQGH